MFRFFLVIGKDLVMEHVVQELHDVNIKGKSNVDEKYI